MEELQSASSEQLDAWANLPSFDGRSYGYVTPERNQSDKLICWAYTAVGAVEANILRKGIDPTVTKSTLNLDEIATAYVRHNRDGKNDPLFNTTDDTFSDNWNQGAHADEAFLAMMQGYSPVDDQNLYGATDDEIKKAVSESDYYVRGYTLIPNDREAIKHAILEYGAVTMEYKAPQTTWQSYLYYSDGTSLGHASLIVGWDDTVDSGKFSPDRPSSNGAWIVKNSWGSGGTLLNGTYCFYLSYQSYLSNNLYVVDTSMKKDYPNLYYYDGTIVNNDTNFITDAHGAIFEAKLSSATEQEQLKAVVFGFKNKKLTANIKVYRHLTANPGNVNDKINDPSGGKLVAEKYAYFENEGIYTVDLDEPIDLDQGEYFSVVVSGTDADGNPLFAMYGSDSKSSNDMTYRLYNNVWTSMKDGGYYADNANYKMSARIRAVTDTVLRDAPLENDMQYARVEIAHRLLYYVKDQPQIPEITVYFGDEILQKGRDYTVRLYNNSTPGLATVEIVGKNGYFGTRTTTFEVAKPRTPPGALSGTVDVYNNVTRLYQIPIPDGWTWIDNDFNLVMGLSDFSYSLRYVGDDADCYQTKTCSVKVNKIAQDPPTPVDISVAEVEVSGTYVYTGKDVVPLVTVRCNGQQLRAGVDYGLTFQNNVYAGEASVTVTGRNLYSGEKTQTFVINKADYPAQMPETEISVSRKAQTLNDVSLDCEGWRWQNPNETIGERITATAVYDGSDKGNYNFTETEITVVKEEQKDIANLSELRLEKTQFVYDGRAKTPDVYAKDGNLTLNVGIDFRVEYLNNTNAGQAVATVVGTNDYFGSATLYFTIDRAERGGFAVSQQGWTFGDDAPEPTVTGKEEEAEVTFFYIAKEGETLLAPPVNAGTYTVRAEIAASQNYNSAVSEATFVVSPKDISAFALTVSGNSVYTGEPVCPKAELRDGQIVLKENVDFTVSYSDNVNAGNAATVIVGGINNYTGSAQTTFEIQKAKTIDINTSLSVRGELNLAEIALPTDFVWDEESLVAISDNVYRATAIYTGGNYDIDSLVFEITVEARPEPDPIVPEPDVTPQPPKTSGWIWLAVAVPAAAVAVAVCLTVFSLKRKKR